MKEISPRERFKETFTFGKPDRVFLMPQWFWRSSARYFAIFLEPRAYRLTCIVDMDWITDICKKAYGPIVSWIKNMGIDLVGVESQGHAYELTETWARVGINFTSLEASSAGDIE